MRLSPGRTFALSRTLYVLACGTLLSAPAVSQPFYPLYTGTMWMYDVWTYQGPGWNHDLLTEIAADAVALRVVTTDIPHTHCRELA
jgi:hypothetical protein